MKRISEKTELIFSTRALGEADADYSAVSEGLSPVAEVLSGSGESNDPYKCSITVKNNSYSDWKGVIKLEVVSERTNPRFYMPGYMYGRNTAELPNTGRKFWPRIREGATKLPESEFWMTRSDRLAMPVSLVYDEGHIYGICAKPFLSEDKYAGFTCDYNKKIDEKNKYAACGYTLGYENAPWLFIQSNSPVDRTVLEEKNVITVEAGKSVEFEIQIYDFMAENMSAIYDVFEDVYFKWHEEPRKVSFDNGKGKVMMTEKLAAKLLSDALYEYAYIPKEKMYTGFVHDRRVGHVYDPETGFEYNKIYSLTWTDGLTAAVPVLMAGLKLGEDYKVEQAKESINYILNNCMNSSSGLPYEALNDGVWSNHGWWYDGMHTPGHTGYLCGQALFYVLKAFEQMKKYRGIYEDSWLDFVSPVVAKINKALNGDYEYPFAFSEETGAGLEYNSFGSCWCVAATAYYILITGKRDYLDTIIRSEEHYYNTYLAKLECYGGPLDTDKAIDDEGILAYVRAVRYLYEITGDKKYLSRMREAIGYECSFKLCYNTPVKVPPLSDIGWSSCGGSITSVANPHIHPMSSTIIDDMLFYCKETGDEYVKSRTQDTIYWGMQTFNLFDGEYGYGKVGWMSERFCFCEGLMTEFYDDGTPASTWFALMSWASGSILEGTLHD